MVKILEKEDAIALRRKGLSYGEILEQVPVAKSTLSLWLQEVGLSKEQRQRLSKKKLSSMKRGWETVRRNRIERSESIRKTAIKEVSHLIADPLWLAGVMLYWAEGKKEKVWRTGEMVTFSNMDANMHMLFLRWVRRYVSLDKEILIFHLYIHEGANVDRAKRYWSDKLNIPVSNFTVYYKRHKLSFYRKNDGDTYFGLLCIRIRRSVDLNRKIAGWIEGVVKYL